jgi:DNA-binding transcriptional ArsR family regulator
MEFLEKNSNKVAEALKAIASPVRLKILRALSNNRLSAAIKFYCYYDTMQRFHFF